MPPQLSQCTGPINNIQLSFPGAGPIYHTSLLQQPAHRRSRPNSSPSIVGPALVFQLRDLMRVLLTSI
ncbi:hypothetical protein ACFX15_028041 [Malus domestica]